MLVRVVLCDDDGHPFATAVGVRTGDEPSGFRMVLQEASRNTDNPRICNHDVQVSFTWKITEITDMVLGLENLDVDEIISKILDES